MQKSGRAVKVKTVREVKAVAIELREWTLESAIARRSGWFDRRWAPHKSEQSIAQRGASLLNFARAKCPAPRWPAVSGIFEIDLYKFGVALRVSAGVKLCREKPAMRWFELPAVR